MDNFDLRTESSSSFTNCNPTFGALTEPDFSPQRNDELKQSAVDIIKDGSHGSSTTDDPFAGFRTIDSKEGLKKLIDGKVVQDPSSDILPDLSIGKELKLNGLKSARLGPIEKPLANSEFPMGADESGSEAMNKLLKRFADKAMKITPEERTETKDALGKDVSPLISDADKKTLKSMQEAIVDGNAGKLA